MAITQAKNPKEVSGNDVVVALYWKTAQLTAFEDKAAEWADRLLDSIDPDLPPNSKLLGVIVEIRSWSKPR